MEHIYVDLKQDADGYPPYKAEELDAERVGPGRYRVEGIPAFVKGLARHDVVEVFAEQDGKLWIGGAVLAESGHWTVRVIPWDVETLEAVAAEFVAAGCHAHATPFGLVAVDVPPELAVPPLMAALTAGRDAGRWDFDIGIGPQVGTNLLAASDSLISGKWDWPIHGMRYPANGESTGWFLWTGDLSADPDFFKSWHVSHLLDAVPTLARLLTLPPGTRFLVAPGREDVWDDPALLDEE